MRDVRPSNCAFNGSNSATNNASSSIQRAFNTFSDGLDGLKLSLHETTSNAGHNILHSTLDPSVPRSAGMAAEETMLVKARDSVNPVNFIIALRR